MLLVLYGGMVPCFEIWIHFAHGYSALCAGLREGALTGRRPLGLASLVARLFLVP